MRRLREMRLAKGLTQTEVAARARLHPQQLSAFELGRAIPYAPQLKRLARALGVPASEAQSLLEEVQAEEGR